MDRWLIWAIAGFVMESDGGQTFSHWSATRDDAGFATIITLLFIAIGHIWAMRHNCFGFSRC